MRQDYRENLKLALDTLRTHKLRSFLTIVGVVIGVMIIIVVAGLLAGFNSSVTEAITGYGADTAFISKFEQGFRTGRLSAEERRRKDLTLEEGQALLEGAPDIKAVAISIFADGVASSIRYKDEEVSGLDFRGTFPAFAEVYANANLKEGRFLSDGDNEHKREVTVIGESVAKALFPTVDPIGKLVTANGHQFEVIGVFELPKGGFGMNNEDRRVVIPYYTFRKLYPNSTFHGYRIQSYANRLDAAVDEAKVILRRTRRVPYSAPDDFAVQTSQQAIESFYAVLGAVALAMLVLSSIGLLIGGVGVMNIMLVSVTERTREIGVRKAIGARRGDITRQFLFEAMTLTGIGGVMGILLGWLVTTGVGAALDWRAVVPMWAVIVGFGVSVGIGLVFGVWPALKAARLDPVVALRYE
ncbi:MAG TPA: ABC transporter permease [Candidatus Solibacter sp.]|nr:ABC transporter permease [Candidatus Solibacter sp.]